MDNQENENKYAAELYRARYEDEKRQRAGAEQQEIQDASENPDWRPGDEGGKNRKHKISTIIGFLMIAVALIVDGISALLAVFVITEPLNWIVWLYAMLGFFIWLKICGISWSDAKGKKTMMMFGAATGIEFVPFLSAFPAWTGFVIGAIINDRIEEVLQGSPFAQRAVGVLTQRNESQERENKRKDENTKRENERKTQKQKKGEEEVEQEEIRKKNETSEYKTE